MPFTPKSLFPRDRIFELLQAISLVFWTFLWGFALTMSGLLILGWLWGDRLLAVRLTNYLRPWLLMALLAAIIPAVLFRRIWLILALVVPVLAIGIGYLPIFLPHHSPQAENRAFLDVMSFNVWSENPSMMPAAEMILRENPDILLLQEISREQIRELTRALRAAASGDGQDWQVLHEPGLMQAVVSRHPLTPLMVDRKKGKAQLVGVATPEGEVTVINVHPLRGGWSRRHRQMAKLLEEDVLKVTGPLILGGDFNTNDMSETYRLLSRHLRNAHWEAGRGFGFTYPAYLHTWDEIMPAWPLVRIDHIFYNNDFLALDARTFKESYGSDHFPVSARLAWKNSGQGKAPPPSSP